MIINLGMNWENFYRDNIVEYIKIFARKSNRVNYSYCRYINSNLFALLLF